MLRGFRFEECKETYFFSLSCVSAHFVYVAATNVDKKSLDFLSCESEITKPNLCNLFIFKISSNIQ